MPRPQPKPHERVIVALDVPSVEEALAIVDELSGVISFFKIGLELLMSGGAIQLLHHLRKDKQVFVDLKLPPDIPETIRRVVKVAADAEVNLLTLSHVVNESTMRDAAGARGGRPNPQLLYVSWLSSLDRQDFAYQHDRPDTSFEDAIVHRCRTMQVCGADGFIVSGPEIAVFRKAFPDNVLVSPGIRQSGAASDDHKRFTTPGEAIRLGADYIVVGRPIRNVRDRAAAAQAIIDEVTIACAEVSAAPLHRGSGSSHVSGGEVVPMHARGSGHG